MIYNYFSYVWELTEFCIRSSKIKHLTYTEVFFWLLFFSRNFTLTVTEIWISFLTLYCQTASSFNIMLLHVKYVSKLLHQNFEYYMVFCHFSGSKRWDIFPALSTRDANVTALNPHRWEAAQPVPKSWAAYL